MKREEGKAERDKDTIRQTETRAAVFTFKHAAD